MRFHLEAQVLYTKIFLLIITITWHQFQHVASTWTQNNVTKYCCLSYLKTDLPHGSKIIQHSCRRNLISFHMDAKLFTNITWKLLHFSVVWKQNSVASTWKQILLPSTWKQLLLPSTWKKNHLLPHGRKIPKIIFNNNNNNE